MLCFEFISWLLINTILLIFNLLISISLAPTVMTDFY